MASQSRPIIQQYIYSLRKLLSFFLIFCFLLLPNLVFAVVNYPADFNGDGYEDLAIGVPSEDVGSIVDAGAVHIIYGSSAGIQSNDQIWHLNSPGVLLGAVKGDRMGSALATGDFNHDGYADLAIGIPFKDNNMGQVVVLYGSADGLSAAGNQVWNQDKLADMREQGDQFGSALTAGDFNADGYSDLAIGVPMEDFPDVGPPGGVPRCGICPDAGVVNLVYGSSTGLSANRNELWHQDRGIDFDGWDNWVEWHDCFGASLDTGDFDGNGADDLAIGGVCEQTGGAGEGALNNGAVTVYYGAPGVGLTISGPGYLRQWYPSIFGWPQQDDAYGYALAVGDFNSDGFSDLAIGVPGEEADCGDVVDAGAVAVFYGMSGKGLDINDAGRNELWCRNSVGILGNGTGRWGTALASGDFNADGFDDVAIGAPLDDIEGVLGAGSISILYGSELRLSSSGNQLFSQNSPGIVDNAQAGDWYGHSLTAADFNGDGVQDLAVGIPFENIGSVVNAGAVNLIYGSLSIGLSDNANHLLHQNSDNIVDQSESGDEFGGRLLPQLYKSPWPDQPLNDEDDMLPGNPPSNVTASVDTFSDKVAVSWGAVTAATYYELWRSTIVDLKGTQIGLPTGTSFDDTTAAPGTDYWYGLKACNDDGCSAFSEQALGRRMVTPVPPAVPENVTASDDTFTDKIAVSWNSAIDASYYEVYRSTAFGDNGNLIASPTATNFNDTSVSISSTYFYSIKACNGGGCSAFSAQDQGSLAVAPANPPGNITASDDTFTDKIAVSWDAVKDADFYELYRSTASGDNGNLIASPTATNYDDTNASTSTTYFYSIKACNGAGCSTFSIQDQGSRAAVAGTPPANPPRNITASVDTFTDKVAVSWGAVTGATYYELWRSTVAARKGIQIGSPTGTSFDDTTAIPGTDYWYGLKACNDAGCSSFSGQAMGRRAVSTDPAPSPDPIPAAPASVAASDDIFTDKIAVSWNSTIDATYYEVYRSTASGNNGNLIASPVATNFYDTSVVAGITYFYSIKSCNGAGCSAYSVQDQGSRATATVIQQTQPAGRSGGGALHAVSLLLAIMYLMFVRRFG